LLIITPSSKTDWASLKQLHWRPAVGLLILMSTYGAMLAPLGFIFATSIFLVAAFTMLGIHQWWVSCLVSVALTLAFWGLMRLLGIYLAPGDMVSPMGWAA
jgi:putative tricarboxylic transport membrane protein